MVGGYAMINCDGLLLTDDSAQTIDGIFERVDAAYKSGKPCLAYNCGYNNGAMSPISVMILDESETEYVATSSILQVRISNDDSCTVVSLLS